MDARSLLRAKKAERGTAASAKGRKRQAETVEIGSEKKRRSEVGVEETQSQRDLPGDFFDGGVDSTAHSDAKDSPEERTQQDTNDNAPTEQPQQPQQPQRSIEDELMAFDNEISQLDTQPQQPAYNPQVYANATISADPILNTQTNALNDGLPDSTVPSHSERAKVVSEEQKRMDEEEKLRRIQAYENEDYALRLEEEARAQEEADARVSALKSRMEEIKARRRK